MILNLLGFSPRDNVDWIANNSARTYLESLPFRQRKPWLDVINRPEIVKDNSAMDLLDKLLSFNPNSRITVEEALAHPYVRHYYDPQDEPIALEPFNYEMELDE